MQLALVDDHTLFRKALAACVANWENYRVIWQAGNSIELKEQLERTSVPDLMILDLRMPGMNGFQVIEWLQQDYSSIKLLAVSMLEEEDCLEKLMKMGVHGFLPKDADPEELKKALDQISTGGYFLPSANCRQLIKSRSPLSHRRMTEAMLAATLSDRERQFLQWLCSDKSYKEIAAEMYVSPRTIDGYRDALLKKINVSSRIGLVTFAIRQGIVVL